MVTVKPSLPDQSGGCNLADDDCDGRIDERKTFAFSRPIRIIARLWGRLRGPNAAYACQVGACVIASCTPGFLDYNGDPSDGCEADCVITAGGCEVRDEETCDVIDEDLTSPMTP